MPRGNAADTAEQELQQQYGDSGRSIGNVAALIDAHMAGRDPEHDRIAQLPIRQEATEKLELDSIDAPGYVVAAAVRGDGVSYVYADETGRLRHGATPHQGDEWQESSESATRLNAVARMAAANDMAALQAERERKIAEATAKIDEEITKLAEEKRAEAQKASEAKAAEAEKAAADKPAATPEAAAEKAGAKVAGQAAATSPAGGQAKTR